MDTGKVQDLNEVCAECKQRFPQSLMVSISQYWVCAGCKPVFLQRLSEGATISGAGPMYRFRRDLVIHRNTSFPDNCVKCNAAADGFRLKRMLSWHSGWYYLLIIPGLLIYAIVALIVRKKAVVEIALCKIHRNRRKAIIAGSWLTALLGLIIIAVGSPDGAAPLVGVLLMFSAFVFGMLKSRVIHATKIDPQFIWIRGACPDYLTKLPEWIESQ